jgi:HD-GYP domain-containing protein (c-di-GMP phosphodiesterase class II)
MITVDKQIEAIAPSAKEDAVVSPDSSQILIPVALHTLSPTSVLDYDLFLWANDKSSPVLYRERNLPFTREDIDRLLAVGVGTLYLPVDDHARFRKYLQESVVDNANVAPHERYRTLKELNRSVFEAALLGRNLNAMVQVADTHASKLAEIICDRELILDDLFRLMDHDYYTYTHATNVCTYSIVLAHSLGFTDVTELTSIGTAALLHDLGKRFISPDVLNKPGKLNDEEWDLIRQHPSNAFDELVARGDLSWDQLMLVYQHHERLNGRGYPVGLCEDEIHDWARIGAIADVFDALTSDRPYRKPDSIEESCRIISQPDGAFDKEMVKCWISIVKPHP